MTNPSYVIIDSGNTRLKWTIWTIDSERFEMYEGSESLNEYLSLNPVAFAIYSDVGGQSGLLQKLFNNYNIPFERCNHHINLPFDIQYTSPETLGDDRIALVAGAVANFQENTSLIIDLGTCITYDLIVNGKTYLGGAISPGLRMRYKAMHQFTSSLPNLEVKNEFNEIGVNTPSSMVSGINNGILGELNYFIERTENIYGPVNVLVSGGDKYIFESKLKHNIFASENLILEGLISILKYNEFFL